MEEEEADSAQRAMQEWKVVMQRAMQEKQHKAQQKAQQMAQEMARH